MEITSPIYGTMVSLYPISNTFDIGFDFVLKRNLNTKILDVGMFFIYIILEVSKRHHGTQRHPFQKISQGGGRSTEIL